MKVKNNFAAIIVLYNPDIKRLEENINAILEQISFIVLVDNGSNNIDLVEKKYGSLTNFKIIKNIKNLGIAKALNQGMEFCDEKYEWVLTVDQDSIIPLNMIEIYRKYCNLEDVAIITPAIYDRNQKTKLKFNANVEYVKRCITSGALTNVKKWKQCGKFDEKMFIDIVDFEYCFRVIWEGYKIIRVNEVLLLHECGKIKEISFFGNSIKIFNHSALRKYYFARNWIYVKKKHGKKIALSYIVKQYIVLIGKTVLFEKNRIEKLNAIRRGIIDGLHMNMGEYIEK